MLFYQPLLQLLHVCALGEGGGKDKCNISGLYLLLMFSITDKCRGSDSQTELETAFQLAIKFLQLLVLLSALLNKS